MNEAFKQEILDMCTEQQTAEELEDCYFSGMPSLKQFFALLFTSFSPQWIVSKQKNNMFSEPTWSNSDEEDLVTNTHKKDTFDEDEDDIFDSDEDADGKCPPVQLAI